MPRGIGFYDFTEYIQSLLRFLKDKDISYDLLSDELKQLIENPTNIKLNQLSEELKNLIMSINDEVGYDNLDQYLKSKIDDIGKIDGGSGDAVYISNNNIFKGVQQITEDTKKVGFICGEIKDFTMFKDTLNVYLNTIRLAEGVDYVISEDGVSIESLREEGWTLESDESVNIFEFEQYKNSTLEGSGNEVIINDYIAKGTITLDRFSPEVQQLLYNSATTINSNVYFGYREISNTTNLVNFICGEILSFEPDTDVIEVYLNTVRLTRGVHYDVSEDNKTIYNLQGSWIIANKEEINFFEFVVRKNVNASFEIGEDNAFVNTANIVDGAVTIDKVAPDLQELLHNTATSINTNVYFGYKEVTESTNVVNFICGEILSFSPTTDIIEVYLNTVRLTRGVHYSVSEDNKSIHKLGGDNWEIGDKEETNFFEFVVRKNVKSSFELGEDTTFVNTVNIVDEAVTIDKLTADLQNKISSIENLNNRIDDLDLVIQGLVNTIADLSIRIDG